MSAGAIPFTADDGFNLFSIMPMKEDELREIFGKLESGMKRLEVAISGDDLGNLA